MTENEVVAAVVERSSRSGFPKAFVLSARIRDGDPGSTAKLCRWDLVVTD